MIAADAAEHLISSISREAEELQGEAPAARICVIIDTLTVRSTSYVKNHIGLTPC